MTTGLPDRLVIYRDVTEDTDKWRWWRVASGGAFEPITNSAQGYPSRQECMEAALRANDAPYLLELDSDIELEIDASGRVQGPAA
jgi:hypothetical protein